MSAITKPKTTPTLLAHLTRLHQAGPSATAQQVDSNAIYMGRLVEQGLVEVIATVKHTDEHGNARRGRPMNIYRPTAKGRARARRALAKQA
jgi:predicted ArsR family transcriptional regulator